MVDSVGRGLGDREATRTRTGGAGPEAKGTRRETRPALVGRIIGRGIWSPVCILCPTGNLLILFKSQTKAASWACWLPFLDTYRTRSTRIATLGEGGHPGIRAEERWPDNSRTAQSLHHSGRGRSARTCGVITCKGQLVAEVPGMPSIALGGCRVSGRGGRSDEWCRLCDAIAEPGKYRSVCCVIPAARLVDSNVIWCGSERYDSASPLDGGDSDDRSDHPFGAIGG